MHNLLHLIRYSCNINRKSQKINQPSQAISEVNSPSCRNILKILLLNLTGRNKLFFGINATNKMDKDATVRFELNGKKIELLVPAKSKTKILSETSDPAPVSVDGVRNDNGNKVLLNNEDTATFSPTKKKIYHQVVIRNGKLLS